MTPREAAVRLFDRVMRAVSAGDTLEARTFAPMAVAAYELVDPLDVSGTFDLSLLRAVNRDFEGALEVAESGLGENPDHLFLLSAAGAAAAALGDTARAGGHYRRILEVYPAESVRERPEYLSRPALMGGIRSEAENFLGSGNPPRP